MSDSELIEMARQVRANAHAPYSKFAVGAALVTKSGKIFTGCNVENISLGLTICAERVAVGAAVSGGQRDFEAIAIVTQSKQPAFPCGACRQVLAEFDPDLRIVTSTLDGRIQSARLTELLPGAKQGISEFFQDV